MSYTPKYCCQCGEKIERTEKTIWDSRRFCGLCQTEHRMQDVIQYLPGIGLALVILLTGFVFQKSAKPLNVAPNQLMSAVNAGKAVSTAQNAAPSNSAVAPPLMPNGSGASTPANASTTVKTVEAKAKPAANPVVEVSEKVYFCGAATKKGTPCSRRVKGGGRCWQHAGQTAMLAQEKLFAGQ